MGNERIDTSSARDHWDRIASELRAYQQIQQQAWGDLDSTVLGRYLAGEADSEELRQVEQALDTFPELNRLAVLVKDVLGESTTSLRAEPPQTLPFPAKQAALRPSQRGKRVSRWALLAAASVLFALGLGFSEFTSGTVSSLAERKERANSPFFAMRTVAGSSNAPALARFAHSEFSILPPEDLALLRTLDDKVGTYEREGKLEKALKEAQRYVQVARASGLQSNPRMAWHLNKVGMRFQEQGDLTHAEESLNQAHRIYRAALGENNPYTIQTGNNLAKVYAVALNQAAPSLSSSPHGESALGFTPEALSGTSRAAHPPPLEVGMAKKPPEANRQVRHSCRLLYDRITNQKTDRVQQSILPLLERSLKDAATSEERAQLAQAIAQLGPAARSAVPTLTSYLARAEDFEEKRALLFALSCVGPDARKAAPVLVRNLSSNCAEARQLAACSLVQVAPSARDELVDLASEGKADREQLRRVLQRMRQGNEWIGVRDPARLWSVRTLCESQRQINALAQNHGVEVRVETIAGQAWDPQTLPGQPQPTDKDTQSIHLFVSGDGSTIHISTNLDPMQSGIDLNRLRRLIEERLQHKDFDGGLRQGLTYLTRALNRKSKSP
jgi:tetratricopeptide (TPR) repeat protein